MEKISISDIAKVLHKDPQIVRELIKDGLFPFAVAYKRKNSNRYNYTIFPAKLIEYIGDGGTFNWTRIRREWEEKHLVQTCELEDDCDDEDEEDDD